MRVLTPAELQQRLAQDTGSPMLELLARQGQRGAAGAAGARHASMRHVVAWCWRQLTPSQAAVLEAMSVLHIAPAAEAAVALINQPAALAQKLIGELRDASLVRHEPAARGQARYSLLQPVREFAAEPGSAAMLAARPRPCSTCQSLC